MAGQKNQDKVTIGEYPLISIAEARIKRSEFKKMVMDGVSPAKQKQEHKRQKLVADDVNGFTKLWLERE